MRNAISTCLAAAALLACSPETPPKTPAHSAEASESSSASSDAPAAKPTVAKADTPAKSPKPAPQPAANDDYEMTHNDCRVLASAYRRAWLNDKVATIGDKVSEKQAELARSNYERASRQAEQNWLSECSKTVGSPFLRSRLVCATKAKRMKRFNDCWDGKVK